MKWPEVAADVVVLAGDIDCGTKGVAWARQAFPDVPVLSVAGNHEHYTHRETEEMKRAFANMPRLSVKPAASA